MAGKVIITCALTGSGHTPSMSLEVATPAEAREMLGLKGLDNVGY